MKQEIRFYKDKVAINCLAKDIKNAREIYNVADGHMVVGVLSKNFNDVEKCIEEVEKYKKDVSVSLGLGAGDPNMWDRVFWVAEKTAPAHINQVFTGAPVTKGMLKSKRYDSIVNSLISPTGIVGKVKISTGAFSEQSNNAIVDTETAVLMLKDMEVDAVKFFNMNGLSSIDELRNVAKMCAKYNVMLEPTGGINLGNFEEILMVCLEEGVCKIIPHIYNSIIGKDGYTKPSNVSALYNIIKKIV